MYKFFIVLLGVTVTCASGFHKIPLYRKPGSMRQELVGRMESRRSFDLTLQNYRDLQYYANVAFGSPPQPVVAAFDTGSADVWVLSEKCNSFACKDHSSYNSSSSGSYEANGTRVNITYNYMRESMEGFLSTDFITIADAKFKQTFTEVQSVNKDLLFYMEFDAIVGMGFRSTSRSGAPTMFENMMATTHTNPIFSFYFNRDEKEAAGGVLTLGGLNDSYYRGVLRYVPVEPTYSFWQFTAEYIHLGRDEISQGYTTVKAHTGMSLIVAPFDQAMRIYKLLGATQDPTQGLQTVDCSRVPQLPPLTFTISGTQYPLESSDYIIRKKIQSIEICIVGIRKRRITEWILGNVFLGRYYSVYDVGQKRIGLAEAVHPFIG